MCGRRILVKRTFGRMLCATCKWRPHALPSRRWRAPPGGGSPHSAKETAYECVDCPIARVCCPGGLGRRRAVCVPARRKRYRLRADAGVVASLLHPLEHRFGGALFWRAWQGYRFVACIYCRQYDTNTVGIRHDGHGTHQDRHPAGGGHFCL